MRLQNISAVAHPFGNRVDLHWKNPAPDLYPSVSVVRREASHPTSPSDGIVLAGPIFLFDLNPDLADDLDKATISDDLKRRFLKEHYPLSESAWIRIELPGAKWQLVDRDQTYIIRKNRTTLHVYDERSAFRFSLESNFQNDLDKGSISSELKQKFLINQASLTESATLRVEIRGTKWQILDGGRRYIINNNTTLSVYDQNLAFLFDLELKFQSDLDNSITSTALRQNFSEKDHSLSANASIQVEVQGKKWQISDGEQNYIIRKNDISVYEEELSSLVDQGLQGETVYYYSLFPYRHISPDNAILIQDKKEQMDRHNRATSMATAPYDFAGQMYSFLPAIYHRYDTTLTENPASDAQTETRQAEALHRFLELPGVQLDQLYSLARASLNLYNLDQTDGRLLPLLAQWIGWKTDYKLEVGAQRNEIRFAPQLYQTIGSIPALEATVKRVTGWESHTKEFVHNVARTNQPERLTLWATERPEGGSWSETQERVSVNWVYEGRPAVVREPDDSLTFFYHTFRRHGWDIWSKRYVNGTWQPSEPIVDQPGIDKHPTAALEGSRLWLFWEKFDLEQPDTDRKWRIDLRIRSEGNWLVVDPRSAEDPFQDHAIERRLPAAAADNAGGLWLFWLERVGSSWVVKYNRHNGVEWQSKTSVSLPFDDTQDPRVEDDLFVYITGSMLWLFWARHELDEKSGKMCWRIAYRRKRSLAPDGRDWSKVKLLPRTEEVNPDEEKPIFHDREPAPGLAAGENADKIELFWSSNRSGSWSIWASKLLDIDANTWDTPEQVTGRPLPSATDNALSVFSERAPLAIDREKGTLLMYRSNQYNEFDARYAGTTTFDTRRKRKEEQPGALEDIQAYTYDAGKNGKRTDDNRIARDTVGIYLETGNTNSNDVDSAISSVKNALVECMPITARAVFIKPE